MIGHSNPRIQKELPLKLLRSWEVAEMVTANAAARILQKADPVLVRSAMSKQDIQLQELIEAVRGPGAIARCPQCGVLRAPSGPEGVCKTCYRKERKGDCARCHRPRHHLSGDPGICPRCADIESRPLRPCARCGKEKPIVDRERALCSACVKYLKECARPREDPRIITCSGCGRTRPAARKGRDICNACATSELAEYRDCAECGKYRRIRIKSRSLCMQCSMNHSAAGMVRKFISNHCCPAIS